MSAVSDLGRAGTVALQVTAAPAAPMPLSIRVPGWAEHVEVTLNGAAIEGTSRGGAWEVRRAWARGDRLVVRYALRTRTLEDPADRSRFAIFHGPWLLGVDAHASPAFFDEPFQENRVELAKGNVRGEVGLQPAARPSAAPGAFSTPAAHFDLRYLPGGYPVQPQAALLRPIAEQTGLPDATAWVFWFRGANRER